MFSRVCKIGLFRRRFASCFTILFLEGETVTQQPNCIATRLYKLYYWSMAYDFKNRIDIDGTIKDIQRLYGKEWPRTLAGYIGDMAANAEHAAELQTRRKFDLHSEYVPRGIRSTPGTPAQLQKVAKSLEKYYDGFGAVYLRGSPDPKRSLSFMVHHEVGFKRKPHSVWRSANDQRLIATPGEGLKNKSYRTQSGRIKERYKPGTLLKRFESSGSRYEQGTTLTNKYPGRRGPGKARVPGKVFLIRGNNSGYPIAVRRITRGGGEEGKGKLETLYAMHPDIEVKGGLWEFEDTVIRVSQRAHRRLIKHNVNRLAARF